MTQPFLTIITRCCWRPVMLAKNIKSVLVQTDRDIEQIFIPDFSRKVEVGKANRQFALNIERVQGQYVYVLDDDTMLINNNFVAKLRKCARRNNNPGVIMVKSNRPQFAPRVLPKADAWGKRQNLRIGATNVLCYVTRSDLWGQKVHHWNVNAAGDWTFLKSLVRVKGINFVWLPIVAAKTQQIGWMKKSARFEQCTAKWWKQTVEKFRIANLGTRKNPDWRLQLYAKGR
jgi:hypothetical protein